MSNGYEESLISGVMKAHDASREEAINLINDTFKLVTRALETGRPLVSVSPDEERRILQAINLRQRTNTSWYNNEV